MELHEVAFACGHTVRTPLFGTETRRRDYRAWAATRGTCKDCREADATVRAEAMEALYDLSPLTGSERQVAWARSIRGNLMSQMGDYLDETRARILPAREAEYDSMRVFLITAMRDKRMAKWWINRRRDSPQTLANVVYLEARQ